MTLTERLKATAHSEPDLAELLTEAVTVINAAERCVVAWQQGSMAEIEAAQADLEIIVRARQQMEGGGGR